MAAGRQHRHRFIYIATFGLSAAVFFVSAALLVWSFSIPIPELYRWKNDRAESGRIILYRGVFASLGLQCEMTCRTAKSSG
jgi:hypothetical protein